MKAFEYNFNDFRYPEDMERIIKYLKENGTINISYELLEELYSDFSEDNYCAGWMILNDFYIREFAKWLSEYEVDG